MILFCKKSLKPPNFLADKQQEVDIATLRAAQGGSESSVVRTKESVSSSLSSPNRNKGSLSTCSSTPTNATINESLEPGSSLAEDASGASMSQISGFRRSLSHANSLPVGGEIEVPKFGVSTDKEVELAEVKKK